jgi:hypothetical protein
MNYFECMVDKLSHCDDVDEAAKNFLSISTALSQRAPKQVAVEYATALFCALHAHITDHDGENLIGEFFQTEVLLEGLLRQMWEDIINELYFNKVLDRVGSFGPDGEDELEEDEEEENPDHIWETYSYEEVFAEYV